MNCIKGFVLVTCLVAPFSVFSASGVSADPAPAAAAPAAAPAKPAMSMDAKKAKAADCSKQADAKGLHGEARKKFRSSCKKM